MHRTRLSLALRCLVPSFSLGNSVNERRTLSATGLPQVGELVCFPRRYKSDLEQLDDLLFSLAQERKVPDAASTSSTPAPAAPSTSAKASTDTPAAQPTSPQPTASAAPIQPVTPTSGSSSQPLQPAATPHADRRQGSDRFRQGHDSRGKGRGRGNGGSGSGGGRFEDARLRGQGQQRNSSVRVEDLLEPGVKATATSTAPGAASPAGGASSLNELRSLVEAASGESARLQQQLDAETAALKALKEEQLQAVPLIQRQAVAPAPGPTPLPIAKTESVTAGQIFTPIAPTSSDPQTVTTICHVATTSIVGELIHNVAEVFEDSNNGPFVELVLKVRRTPLQFRSDASSAATASSISTKKSPFGTPLSEENGLDCDYFSVRCFGEPFLKYAQTVLRKGDLVHVMGQLLNYRVLTAVAFSDEGKEGLRSCGVDAAQAKTTVAISVAEGGGVLNLVFGLPTTPQEVRKPTSEIETEEIASV